LGCCRHPRLVRHGQAVAGARDGGERAWIVDPHGGPWGLGSCEAFPWAWREDWDSDLEEVEENGAYDGRKLDNIRTALYVAARRI